MPLWRHWHHWITYDADLCYGAAICHELGFTPAFAGPAPFEEVGARAAPALLHAHSHAAKTQTVYAAIALPMTDAALVRRPEIALVDLGIGVDVAGLRLADIPAAVVQELLAAFTRLGFKQPFLHS